MFPHSVILLLAGIVLGLAALATVIVYQTKVRDAKRLRRAVPTSLEKPSWNH